MPNTQVLLLLALVAMLVLLLVVRSVRRGRERKAEEVVDAAAPAESSTDELATPAEVEAEADAVLTVVADEPEPEAALAEVEPEVASDQDEYEVEPRRRARRWWRRGRVDTADDTVVQPAPDPVVEPEPEDIAEIEPELEPEADVEAESEAVVGPDVERRSGSARSGRTRRRRGRRHNADAEVAEVVSADQAELRALREQLRALEQVVQEQVGEPPTVALARVEETAAEQSAAYLRQISLVVRGLAAHTGEDEDPRHTLARVAAAVERLGVPNEIERPILATDETQLQRTIDGPRSPSHRRDVGELEGRGAVQPAHTPDTDVFGGLAAVPEPVMSASYHAPAMVTQVEPRPEPYTQPSAQPSPQPVTRSVADLPDRPGEMSDVLGAYEPDAVGVPTLPGPDVVLPVPPPAAPEPSAGRRRGRRTSR